MKKIMFNDKYGLTQAVLDGRKSMTRRDCTFILHEGNVKVKLTEVFPTRIYLDSDIWMFTYKGKEYHLPKENYPRYKVGEVVSIAQSYMDIDRFHRKGKNEAYLEYLDSILPELKLYPGWGNKMFVRAELMPHHIKITNINCERLQDISDEDCLKEGVYEDSGDDEFPPSIFYDFDNNSDDGFYTPREAFATLIDKISGKGTWKSNPFVFVYEFELID